MESIEVLINNAGLLINKPFLELTREDLNQSYSVNVLSVIETVQALLPKMPSGHIVNISSMGGFQGSVKFPGLSAYSTSKAALVSFTELFFCNNSCPYATKSASCFITFSIPMLSKNFID